MEHRLTWGAATPCVPGSPTACLIDNSLAANYNNTGHSAYRFLVTLTHSNGNYNAAAAPLVVGTSGVNSFCSIALLASRPVAAEEPSRGGAAVEPLLPYYLCQRRRCIREFKLDPRVLY